MFSDIVNKVIHIIEDGIAVTVKLRILVEAGIKEKRGKVYYKILAPLHHHYTSHSSSYTDNDNTSITLDYRNEIFIAVLAFYSYIAIFSIIRLFRHSIKRTAVERVLLLFSIGRILRAVF